MAEGEKQPTQAPVPPPQPEAPRTPSAETLKQIRTFQGDVASALARQRESLVSISRAEQAKNPRPHSQSGGNSLTYFLLSIILIGGAGAAGYLAYNEFLAKTTPPAPDVPQGRFVSAENSAQINISGLSREEIFANIRSASETPNSLKQLVVIENIATTTRQVSLAQFLQSIGSGAPGSLTRSFNQEFMLGYYRNQGFLIASLNSYPNAFAGMLSWENSLPADLAPLFKESEKLKKASGLTTFRDVVWNNKDVRALYSGTSTTPIVLYSFFDNKYLIIADQLNTLDILIERLTREKLSR